MNSEILVNLLLVTGTTGSVRCHKELTCFETLLESKLLLSASGIGTGASWPGREGVGSKSKDFLLHLKLHIQMRCKSEQQWFQCTEIENFTLDTTSIQHLKCVGA